MDIFDVIMIPLFLILILWSIIVLVISKKQRKKIENQEKKTGYSDIVCVRKMIIY